MKYDGRSIAPQLRGEPGQPREWAYMQLGNQWFVRNAGFKMNEQGQLFDMGDAPFVEKPVAAEADTEPSTAVLAELNPAAGKTDPGAANAGKRPGKAQRNQTPK